MTLTNRTLAKIADDLRSALKRETDDILTIGGLLIEAKAQVNHGEWLPWLKKEFSISERSAQKYVKAAEFAAKYELGADLKLSPSALYLLSEDGFWNQVKAPDRLKATDAVIKAARHERLGYDRAKEIIDTTLPKNFVEDVAEADVAEVDVDAPGTEREPTPEPIKARQAVNPNDDALIGFSAAVMDLIRRTTKQKPDRFVGTSISPDDLAKLGEYLSELANFKKTRATPTEIGCRAVSATSEAMKSKLALLDADNNMAA